MAKLIKLVWYLWQRRKKERKTGRERETGRDEGEGRKE